jgi:hypothetical protein
VLQQRDERENDRETMRARSLIAVFAIIGGLAVYALAAMLLAETLPSSWPLQAAFFAVAGLVWIPPAARIIRWGVGKRPPAGS